jgi:cytochrome c2
LNTILLRTLSVAILAQMSLYAEPDYKKGQHIYNNKCISCHGNDTKGAAMFTQEGWSELFVLDGQKLIVVHSGNSRANKFFADREFQLKKKNLYAFLHKYASDTAEVPECN